MIGQLTKMNLQQEEVKVEEQEITDPYEAGVYYMKKKKIEGKLLFCMVREFDNFYQKNKSQKLAGSIGFNTSFEHSDYDFFGVYVSNLNNYLNLKQNLPITTTTSTNTLIDMDNLLEMEEDSKIIEISTSLESRWI